MIDPAKLTAFDVETWGREPAFALQPFRLRTRDAWLTSFAWARTVDGDIHTGGMLRPTKGDLEAWLDGVIERDQYVVCWNAPFDVAWLIALGFREKVLKVRWLDGMLLYRHKVNAPRYRAEGRASLGLKAAVTQFLPFHAGYEDDVTFNPQTDEEWETLGVYNERDAKFTLMLTTGFINTLEPEQLRCAVIEARTIPLAADALVEGIAIDTKAAETLAETQDETRKLAFMKLKLAHPEDITPEVLASPKQLGALLFEKWQLPVYSMTDKGQPSTDKEALHRLGLTDPRAKLVYEYREASNNRTKFCVGPVESVFYNSDGRTRPAFRIFGTYTGRGTYSSKTGQGKDEVPTGVALHQWKRDPDYRKIVTVPDGYDLLEFDFAGQEYRWMAVESKDPTMLSMCQPGEDPHSYMGARCTGVSYEYLRKAVIDGDPAAKPKRQLGKVANLSLQYRTSPPTLVTVAAVQHKVVLTEAEARAIHATYITTYRAVPEYWKRQIAKARLLGYVETLAGRRVQLGPVSEWKYEDGNNASWAYESTAINFPIQGIGADQKYLAMMALRSVLPRYDARFYFELHDGAFIIAPKDKSARAAVELKAMLSNLPYEKAWGVKLPIAFPVDAKRGPNWGELKEVQ